MMMMSSFVGEIVLVLLVLSAEFSLAILWFLMIYDRFQRGRRTISFGFS